MNLNSKYFLHSFLSFCFLLSICTGCKKADHFYDTLKALPQIDNSLNFAYKAAYIIGDTMVISGSLHPQNNLQISIGGVAAHIVKIDSVRYDKGNNTLGTMDQVKLLITQPMEGKAKEVKVANGGFSVIGNPVDVYGEGGAGSFTDSLNAVTVKALPSGQLVMMYCRSNKGDVYYYAATTKNIRHLKKDGTEEVIYDLSKSIDPISNVLVNGFLAGGVDPQCNFLYFSVATNQGYRFCKLDLTSKQLITLNQSSNTSAPYEGTIGSVHMIVTGVYPDSKGNLYLGMGLGNTSVNQLRDDRSVPDAIAKYSTASGQISYIFKGLVPANKFAGMPGVTQVSGVYGLYYSPDENLLYAVESSGARNNAFEIYDLTAGALVQSLVVASGTSLYDVISPFSGLQIDLGYLGNSSDNAFGYLPMPGKRLQVLLYQFIGLGNGNGAAQMGFPKWIVFDFTAQRTYALAPGRFNQGNNLFLPSGLNSGTVRDEVLNTDEAGNLYMTANGKAAIIKTQIIQ